MDTSDLESDCTTTKLRIPNGFAYRLGVDNVECRPVPDLET
jgi:hypothetical protein